MRMENPCLLISMEEVTRLESMFGRAVLNFGLGDDQATRPLDMLLMGCQIASADLKTYGTLGFFATKTIPSPKRGK